MSKTKKYNIIILMFTILFLSHSFSQTWLPYYSFNFSEGVYLPSVGKYGWTTVLSNDIGLLVKPYPQHTTLLFYQLKYQGPGLKRQEGEQFEQRNMTHSLVLQHNYMFTKFVFKTRLNYVYDFWRSGTNELWGYGLYDNNYIGLSEEIEYKTTEELKFNFKFGFNYVKFPNYTGLIEEYIAGKEETTSGKQDNLMYLLNLKAQYKLHNAGIMFITQNYINQKVLDETGTYSEQNQKDFSIELNYFYDSIIYKFISLTPYLSIKTKYSNQAFLYLKTYDIITSTPQVIPNYYDYSKIMVSLPISFYLTKTKWVTIAPEFEFLYYTSRNARDKDNNFVDEKQKNFLSVYSISYNSQSPDKHRKVSLFYTYQQQTSNMKFEKYYPYNYSGHYFGLSFSYSY